MPEFDTGSKRRKKYNQGTETVVQDDARPEAAARFIPVPAWPTNPVQRLASAAARSQPDIGRLRASAARAISGSSTPLPHLEAIQRAFGRYDISGVAAHMGQTAAEETSAMDAHAFTSGNHVAFAHHPDLHTAAHEAAHVVQQRGGVSLTGGIGSRDDRYERHAEAVADLVVGGRSSAALLAPHWPVIG